MFLEKVRRNSFNTELQLNGDGTDMEFSFPKTLDFTLNNSLIIDFILDGH